MGESLTATVRRAAGGDLDVVADVLAEAFSDYAWTRWTVDADAHEVRIRKLQRLTVKELALPYGEVWVATDDADALVSAALWLLPEPTVPSSVSDRIAPVIASLEGNRHDASRAAGDAIAGLRPKTPHFYLGAVGTRPGYQGRGLASAVLAPVLRRADAAQTEAFLETSALDNVAFYERLGFTVMREIDVPDGGPHVWAMRRRPR